MDNDVYRKLAKVLDTLPNGFPETGTDLEIRLLKKLFTPEEADLFCDLRLSYETAEQISHRTGCPLEGLEKILTSMWKKGQIRRGSLDSLKAFKMMPWAWGIFESQIERDMFDLEYVEICKEYQKTWGQEFFNKTRIPILQSIPVEKEIHGMKEALPHEKISALIENSHSFVVVECLCRKEEKLLTGKQCSRISEDVCLMINPTGDFDLHFGRPISKEEAHEVIKKAEEAGLVHSIYNIQSGHLFICNCCGCCCPALGGVKAVGNASFMFNAPYYAEIDTEKCTFCGICADDRCQVEAIEEQDTAYQVIREKCIGCGLCIGTCPAEAIKLIRKQPEESVIPPNNEAGLWEETARRRGIDFSDYK